ncbi:hypothetical protein AUC43_01080 [Hymenobacter sedentarius]|uniref:Uncharacterized protein n=1 Tax=Hymenobacter sedentarius TaxID=1411621 RepID=A0A0U4BJG0_9BACT|nr:hypothetical protein [Hymenobacter sedentarius]ALW83818.1 hypothetical protein AUC43_01080 [Hymenobacter sedentarius]
MNFSFNLRPTQSLTASAPLRLASAQSLRAALFGGLAILGCSSAAMGQDSPSVKAQQTDAHTLALTVENPTQQRVQLEVVSSQGHYSRLLNEVHHRPSYGTKLSFNKVPAGDYAVRLRVGRESYRYHVQVPATPQTAILVQELAPTPAQVMVAQSAR